MNFDDLMAVWRSQDAAPLHDMNKTLLHLALRQDEKKLQTARRRERWIHYASSAFVIGLLALHLTLMIHGSQRYVMTAWDYVMGVGGATAALIAGIVMFVGHRSQSRREQRFGDSLRDQLNRRIAQLDYAATIRPRRSALNLVLMGVICPLAILHLGMRINHKTLGDVRLLPALLLLGCLWIGVKGLRLSVQRAVSRKGELESLLKELDDQA